MGSNRIPTKKYPGVYYRIARRLGGRPGDTEKVFYAVWKTKDGKKIEACCGREFRDGMTAARANIMRGEFIEGRRQTRAEKRREEAANPTLAALWEQYSKMQLKVAHTRDSCLSDIRRMPESILKKRPHELTPKDIDNLDKLLVEREFSPQTRKHTLALIARVTRWGVRQQICKPMTFEIQLPQVDNKKTEYLDKKHIENLIKALDADNDLESALIVKLILFTGMRKNAALSLEWRDIDFEKEHITLRGENAKSGRTQTIPMSKRAKEVLQQVPHHDSSPLLFPSSTGGKRWGLPKGFIKRIREAADMPDGFRFLHGLRHNFASLLASSGMVDMFTLQHLLTHESAQMTQRYSHFLDDAGKRGAKAVDALMPKSKIVNLIQDN
jgi:integrase